ncbi:DsbA family protein [Streptacidiphilus fuscans]|uniref:Thioredoxin domain-containing protein n=1 Tax=Streptacidiphilus fuscans TaxID=2789292 RepID=A0A931B7K2_9ACTN|nr:thioredoxin domain-containing protein [Streptacidiphilus fuscans]MBF9070927.1 thioredoxin domain-containing protein [Streptacidiphilus fuscans]
MSQKNDEGKRSARAKMQEERAKQEAKARKKRQYGIIGAVLAVIVVLVAIGILIQNGRSSSYNAATQAPGGTIGNTKLVIPVGATDAPSTVTVYEDPRCPACEQFESGMKQTMNKLLAEGKIQIQYHVVSFIDTHDNGSGSKNAANALGCAQNVGRFHDYHDVLYANQPDETVDAWANKTVLISLAKQVPGLDTPSFESCVNGNAYGSWVTAVETDFGKSGYTSTPTVLLNGTPAYPSYKNQQISPAAFTAWVDEANKGKPLGTLSGPSAAALASPTAHNNAAAPSPSGS